MKNYGNCNMSIHIVCLNPDLSLGSLYHFIGLKLLGHFCYLLILLLPFLSGNDSICTCKSIVLNMHEQI